MASDASINVVASLVAEVTDFVQKFTTDVPAAVQSGMGKVQDAVDSATGKVTEGLNGAAESARQAGEQTGTNFGEGLTLIMAAVATAFLDKLHEAFGEATEMAEDLKNEMVQTGDSAEGVQRLNYAFETFGVSSQAATQSIVMFQRKLEEAAQHGNGKSIFERAGLDPKAMANNPASVNIGLIADKMQGLSTAAERSDLAMQSFGRAGMKLIPILTEGGPALKELEDSADKAGAVLGGEDVEQLDKLREKLNQLAVTAKVFAATFIAPFADMAQSIAQHIQEVYAAFEKLSSDNKLALVFSAIATAALFAEQGLMAFRPILGSLINKEVLDSLLSLSGFITRLVPIVGILAIAWAKNFGGMKEFVDRVLLAVQEFGRNAKAAFDQISASAATLGPSFNALSEAVNRALLALGDLVQGIADNTAIFSVLEAAAGTVITILNDLIQAVTSVLNLFRDGMGPAITGVAVILTALLLPALADAGVALLSFISDEIIMRVVQFGQSIMDLIPKITEMFAAWVAGEDIAFPPMLAVQLVLIAIGGLVLILGANWDKVGPVIYGWLVNIFQWLSKVIDQFASWLGWIAQIIAQIPGFQNLANAIQTVANVTAGAGNAAAAAAQNFRNLADAMAHKGKGSGADMSGASFGGYSAPAPVIAEGGGAHLTAPSSAGAAHHAAAKGPSHSQVNTEALDALKDKLEPYQEAIRKTELLLSQLTVEHDKLEKIDTWPKVVAQSAIYAKQIAATIALEKEQRDLAAQDLRNRAAALALAAKQKDPKEKRKDLEAANAYGVDADNARLKALQDEAKVSALRTAKTAAPIDYEKGVASDSDLPTAVRLAAVNDDILRTLNQEIVSKGALQNRTSELAKLEKTRLDIMAEAAALQTNLVNSQAAMVTAKVNAEQSIRDATPEGAGTQGRAIVNASTDQTNAKADEVAKTRALADAQSQLDEALKKQLASGPAVIALQTAVNLATAAQTTAISASTAAQMKLRQAQEATTPAVLQVRSALLGMAQQVAGPLMNIIKSVNMGVNPLVAIFEELFQKSRSFNDILVTMGKIMDAVAQVFDAMRPVIDLVLGVMIGVVNVFLTMYNVVVKLLDMFGLGIQAVQLVTNSLTGLNNAVPLLQVTHDLPTMNEVNANKMSSLVAQQNNQNNNMAIGFNAGLSKIGEILGTLIGMYALMKMFGSVIGGKGIGATGLIDQVKGLFGGLFSKKTTGAGAQASDFGTWGDAVTNGMTATENSTSDYSGASPTSSDFGTWGTDSVTKGLDKSNMSNFMGNIMHSSAATAIGTSALGALFSGLIGGNKSDAALGGGLGSILSVALKANPLISAGIGVLMPLITGMFGPHYTTDKNPDITNAQINGEAYGQAIANLQGQTVNAGGTAYASQQSTGFLAQISSYIASGGKGLSAALLAEFTGATGIINGKNGILDLSNGVNLQWQQLVNDANTAMAAITAAGGSMANTMQSLLGGATSVNLAALFGNGSSVTAGGYNVMSGGNSNLGNTSASHFTVNIDTVNGTDAASLQTAFQPIFAEYGRQQQIVSRTQANSSGRYNF